MVEYLDNEDQMIDWAILHACLLYGTQVRADFQC